MSRRHVTPRIPPAVCERGVIAFVSVLRRHHPDAVFVVRDGAVEPLDDDVACELTRSTPGDDDPADEAREHLAPLADTEALPERGEAPAGGNPGDPGGEV